MEQVAPRLGELVVTNTYIRGQLPRGLAKGIVGNREGFLACLFRPVSWCCALGVFGGLRKPGR